VRHLYDEGFDIGCHAGPPWIRAPLGAIELLRNQPPVPGQNSGRLGYAGNLGQVFPTETLADFGERRSLRIGKSEPGGKLRPLNPILRREVFALEEQALVH
jgi:hypothetical protein